MRIGGKLREAPRAAKMMLVALEFDMMGRGGRVDRHAADGIFHRSLTLHSLCKVMSVIEFMVHFRRSLLLGGKTFKP